MNPFENLTLIICLSARAVLLWLLSDKGIDAPVQLLDLALQHLNFLLSFLVAGRVLLNLELSSFEFGF